MARLGRSRTCWLAAAVLTTVAVAAAGLLAEVIWRPASGVRLASGVHWLDPFTLSDYRTIEGPFITAENGRAYVLSEEDLPDRAGGVVWSSEDGANWARQPIAVSYPGNPVSRVVWLWFDGGLDLYGFVGDGRGGLIVAGQMDTAFLSGAVGWHAADGVTFRQASVETYMPAGITGVASGHGAVVAIGWTALPPGDTGSQSPPEPAVWTTADGDTWAASSLPGASGFSAAAVVAWRGGFVVFANPNNGAGFGVLASPAPAEAGVWTSGDGRTWQRASQQLTGFSARVAVAIADRLVVFGISHPDDYGYGLPAAWSSSDGRSWVELALPSRGPVSRYCGVAYTGRAAVAVAEPQPVPETADEAGAPNDVWYSGDGSSWQLAPADPDVAVTCQVQTNTPVTGRQLGSVGGHVLLVQAGDKGPIVHLGDVVGMP
jgi:hypothetical protein